NWNVLTIDSREPTRIPRQLSAGDRAAEKGGRIVALTLPVQVPMNMSFLTHCGLFLIPGWKDVLGLPVAERMAELRKPEVQARMLEQAASPEAGVFKRLADFDNYLIGDTYS
ncbi:MAG: D-aminoacylase, partial [Acidimicrobiales bacterium]|nr:D-aminoacylase [Acidimicrobiales bacterium]